MEGIGIRVRIAKQLENFCYETTQDLFLQKNLYDKIQNNS